MRVVLADNPEGVRDILRVVTGRDDLVVQSVKFQEDYANARGHGVRLDVLAEDSKGRLYNIEIQRDSRGAVPKRVRFNFAAVDWNNFDSGKEYDELPETWVVFITEDPSLTSGKPYATARRYFDDGRLFDDGQVVRYVNAAYVGDDLFGKLMADFRETDPDKMHFASLANRVKRIKTTKEGVEEMGDLLEKAWKKKIEAERKDAKEEGREEGREEERVRTIGLLLATHTPDALLHDPMFSPFGYTQADIDAALALSK